MRRCPRCKLIFRTEGRIRCLYCNTLLMTASQQDVQEQQDLPDLGGGTRTVLTQVVRDRTQIGHERMQYIIGSYFRTRTFHFMYTFSRNEFKMDREFKRFLIQPLNYTVFLTLPWAILDVLDSLIFRLFYTGYCKKCNWKFKRLSGNQEHDPDECEYNREYSEIIAEVLSGRILRNENKFKAAALRKAEAGKRCAYRDLCAEKEYFSSVLDVATIWFSICLILYLVVWASYPLTMFIVRNLF